ncbi:XXYS1_4_G0034450.mRNA.1.CDS.1 [Saccharomyces cerevisiae]|nr:XXYS1_4_G0034450.mRNA.1.CDS.1 [Saccharomyces cerevisiae]
MESQQLNQNPHSFQNSPISQYSSYYLSKQTITRGRFKDTAFGPTSKILNLRYFKMKRWLNGRAFDSN